MAWRRLAFACLFSLSLLPLSAQGAKVLISSDPDYPPISWRDPEHPDRIIGVAIELVEMAFKELNIPVESRYVGPWRRTLYDAQAGKIDVVAGVYINEERKTYMEFVQPSVMDDPTVVFVMKGRGFPFEGWQDLIGRLGGARIGDSFGEEVDRRLQENLTIEWVPSFEMLYRKVEGERNQYFVYGLYPGMDAAEKMGIRSKLEHLKTPLVTEGIYIAISKKSPFLRYRDILGQKLHDYVERKVPDLLVEKYLKISKSQKPIPK